MWPNGWLFAVVKHAILRVYPNHFKYLKISAILTKLRPQLCGLAKLASWCQRSAEFEVNLLMHCAFHICTNTKFHHWESISFRFLLEISTPNKISAAFSNIYEECHMYLALWSKRALMHISRKSFILITCHWSVSGSNPAQVQEDLRWIPNYFCTHTLGGGSKIELDRSAMYSSKFPFVLHLSTYLPRCYFLPSCLEVGNIC